MTITFEMVANVLKQGGLFALCVGLVYTIYALVQGKVVVRPWHDAIVAEKDKQLKETKEDCSVYREMAFRGTELAERVTHVAKVAIAPVGEKT